MTCRILQPVQEFRRELIAQYSSYDRRKPLIIGVHIRRKDKSFFLKDRAGGARQFTPQEILFVLASAAEGIIGDYKNPNLVFVVASDDAEWCRSVLNRPGKWPLRYFQEHHSKVSISLELFDLASLSAADHNIVLIGTFAFWGAFLAGGDVYITLDYQVLRLLYTVVWTPISKKLVLN